ncbi:hypothetical protein CVU75_01865 [Candidatus Dependentiae bacterium HGW-Dependentiae-1]|nr:MAG: hypothetical protein CVU75_01865 [Candidatus Dependentiae bacterium HGW-Dependentiae-1]
MSISFGKKALPLLLCMGLFSSYTSAYLSSLNRTDAYPMYSSLDPHSFLYTREKQQIKGYETSREEPERVGFSISPFGQNANFGKDIDGDYSSLGDLNGRWSMIPLLFDDGCPNCEGKFPCGKTLPGTCKTLQSARDCLFPQGDSDCDSCKTGAVNRPGLNNPEVIDPLERFGFFTNNLKYRKHGLRAELDCNIALGFGISGQIGVADISQILDDKCQDMIPSYSCIYLSKGRINLTCFAEPSCGFRLAGGEIGPKGECCQNDDYCKDCHIDGFDHLTTFSVNKLLMDQLCVIAHEIGVDIENFHATSLEEARLNLYWRKAFTINETEDDWPHFLFTPFLMVSGSMSPGKKINPSKIFAAPFGNDGFNAAGFSGGFNFDFYDTVEIGAEFGYTNFFKRTICDFRVPNNKCQQGLYPFTSNVEYHPGCNWMFGAKIAGYHFIDKLSTYFQYVMISHSRDKICLQQNCPEFVPGVLEERSVWNTKLANIGFTYDVSPYLSLGFFWQAPLSQRNTYRSSTVMLSFNGSF